MAPLDDAKFVGEISAAQRSNYEYIKDLVVDLTDSLVFQEKFAIKMEIVAAQDQWRTALEALDVVLAAIKKAIDVKPFEE